MPTKHLFRAVRALFVLLILSGGLLIGPPAGAAPQISFVDCAEASPSPSPSPSPIPTEEPSSESCTPVEGSVVRGTVPIVFEVDTEFGEDLTEVTLSVVSDDQDPETPDAANPVRVWEGPEAVEQERFEYAWDSTRIPGFNGRYKIVVHAASEGVNSEPPDTAERVDLRVDNPPQTPARPGVAGVTGEGVEVEWSPAPEPDVLSYTLYRARTDSADQEPDDSAFEAAVVTKKTALLDEVSEPGAYWYKIDVTRRSIVTPDEGISSDRSTRSDEAGEYVPPTPTPDPTEPPDDGGGGGSGDGGGTVETTPRPRLTPRPLARPQQRGGPPPPSDAPYSDILPYDLPEDGSGSGGADLAQGTDTDDRERGDQGPLPAVAIGTFLVSAALALGRLPTT